MEWIWTPRYSGPLGRGLFLLSLGVFVPSVQGQTPMISAPPIIEVAPVIQPAEPRSVEAETVPEEMATHLPGSPQASPGKGPVSSAAGCDAGCGFDWKKSKYRYQKPFWPIGFPPNPPTGPGYYSLRDCLEGNCREKPPKGGYPRFFATPQPFADVDFSYVDDPKYQPTHLERLHRVHLGEDWMFGTGGEYRNRYNFEGNSRLTGRENNYDLSRLRVFGEIWYQDQFRLYAEFISAQTMGQSLAPLGSERDYADILNLFVDVKAFDLCDEPVYARLGRQQILLGSQRLISPLDWTNAMRTFDGARLTRRSEKFDVDLFWLQPVIPSAQQLNSHDDQQHFAGAYSTYRPKKDQILDTYYLYLNNNNSPATARANGVGALTVGTPYAIHTTGVRYAGKNANGFLWDFENMGQVGMHNDNSLFAGNFSNGLGWTFKDCPMNPTFWAYFDYATGSNSVGGSNTFNQLYPLGHYYLGWMDYVGRANIQDWNFHMYLYPTNWITVNAQYHIFELAKAQDALYNAAGVPIRQDPTGRAGSNVGSEVDLIVNWHLGPHTDIVTAYSHFFAGDFLNATGSTSNLNTLWLIYNFRW